MEPVPEAVQENIARLNKALIAKVLGRHLPFPFLISVLKILWGHFGPFEAISSAPNTVICNFSSPEAREAVLQGGPWLVAGNIVGLGKWSFSSSPASVEGLWSPIWIRLPELPLIYWDVANLSRLASMIGVPLWMDSFTSTWGRSSFARICFRMDLSRKLPPGVWINGIHGRFFQKVQYEGLQSCCFACGVVQHPSHFCSESASPLPSASTTAPPSVPAASTIPRDGSTSNHPLSVPLRPSTTPSGVPSSLVTSPVEELGKWNLVSRKRPRARKLVSLARPSRLQPRPPC
ncbi:uncharacterized protein LOC110098169 [Dendrobium catenatum]|uniref:uncharacterized protein LOC110098169 n=1 Tax=Dendrobium catenatum TaxID=906689 RepID=UPI0009F28ABF|nr:uncharacterized protein LOC110098169 [Dendrobium catenatum]